MRAIKTVKQPQHLSCVTACRTLACDHRSLTAGLPAEDGWQPWLSACTLCTSHHLTQAPPACCTLPVGQAPLGTGPLVYCCLGSSEVCQTVKPTWQGRRHSLHSEISVMFAGGGVRLWVREGCMCPSYAVQAIPARLHPHASPAGALAVSLSDSSDRIPSRWDPGVLSASSECLRMSEALRSGQIHGANPCGT